jgi:PhnB protein
MQLNPYLIFNGNCAAAFKFYEKCLGGKIIMMMTHAEAPSEDQARQVPAAWRDKIMHVRMNVGDVALMGSDAPPEFYEEKKGFSVSLTVDTPADAERIFAALADKGTVRMPMQQTFFASRFGMVVDQFGTPWMINCEAQQ